MTDAKEVGVGNPAEETFYHPDTQNIAKGSATVNRRFSAVSAALKRPAGIELVQQEFFKRQAKLGTLGAACSCRFQRFSLKS
jgi:hypothetical protein